MRIIPVLDLRQGQAVRAFAGDRDHYGPLASVLHDGTDPIDLARALRDQLGLPDLYLADLDAILGEASPRTELYRAIADLGLTLWLDAGVRGSAEARPLVEAGVVRVIVGLETVKGPEALAAIVQEIGPDAVVFSLDLKDGRPLIETRARWGTDRPGEIVARAIEAGVRTLIHLDLARVGTCQGVANLEDLPTEGLEWIIGGGVAGIEDIRNLERAGYHGVLVGSALHDGRIGSQDL